MKFLEVDRVGGVSPRLGLLLLISVGLSVLALCWPDQKEGDGERGARSENSSETSIPLASELLAASATRLSSAAQGPDAGNANVRRLGPAVADPFALPLPVANMDSPPVESAVSPSSAATAVSAPVVEAIPPASQHVLLGRFKDPNGAWRLFVTDPGASGGSVLAVVGAVLSTGWRIQSVGGSEIRLIFPRSGAEASIPIPADSEDPGKQ